MSRETGKPTKNVICLIKLLPFLCIFVGPHGARDHVDPVQYHSDPLARPVRTSGSTGSNETMCQNGRFEPAVHTRAGSGWMGNGVGTRSAKLSAHLALQNSRNSNFLVIFSIFHFWAGVQEKSMISPLLQSINSGTILFETASKS